MEDRSRFVGIKAWAEQFGDWWKTPASTSGLYHWGESQLEHSRMVFRLACKHFRRLPDPVLRKNKSLKRSFLRAALLHDVGKFWNKDMHDIHGFLFMWQKDRVAAYFILVHMGRWGDSTVKSFLSFNEVKKIHNCPSCRFLGELLQALDYTASNCVKIFLEMAKDS